VQNLHVRSKRSREKSSLRAQTPRKTCTEARALGPIGRTSALSSP
jgi:hypothetical protein